MSKERKLTPKNNFRLWREEQKEKKREEGFVEVPVVFVTFVHPQPKKCDGPGFLFNQQMEGDERAVFGHLKDHPWQCESCGIQLFPEASAVTTIYKYDPEAASKALKK